MTLTTNQLNQQQLDNPTPGDCWHERGSPYHVVMHVLENGNLVISDDTGFSFDFLEAKEITRVEHEALIRYPSGVGWCADVVQTDMDFTMWNLVQRPYIHISQRPVAAPAKPTPSTPVVTIDETLDIDWDPPMRSYMWVGYVDQGIKDIWTTFTKTQRLALIKAAERTGSDYNRNNA